MTSATTLDLAALAQGTEVGTLSSCARAAGAIARLVRCCAFNDLLGDDPASGASLSDAAHALLMVDALCHHVDEALLDLHLQERATARGSAQ